METGKWSGLTTLRHPEATSCFDPDNRSPCGSEVSRVGSCSAAGGRPTAAEAPYRVTFAYPAQQPTGPAGVPPPDTGVLTAQKLPHVWAENSSAPLSKSLVHLIVVPPSIQPSTTLSRSRTGDSGLCWGTQTPLNLDLGFFQLFHEIPGPGSRLSVSLVSPGVSSSGTCSGYLPSDASWGHLMLPQLAPLEVEEQQPLQTLQVCLSRAAGPGRPNWSPTGTGNRSDWLPSLQRPCRWDSQSISS